MVIVDMRLIILIILSPLLLPAQTVDSVWVNIIVEDYHRGKRYAISGIEFTIDETTVKTIGVDAELLVLLSKGNHKVEITAMSYYPRWTTITIEEAGSYTFFMVSNGQPPSDVIWEETVPNQASRKHKKKNNRKRPNHNQ